MTCLAMAKPPVERGAFEIQDRAFDCRVHDASFGFAGSSVVSSDEVSMRGERRDKLLLHSPPASCQIVHR